MPAGNVFRRKAGGQKHEAPQHARLCVDRIMSIVEKHGDASRIWFSGAAGNRLIQSATLTGWVSPEEVLPLTHLLAGPAEWEAKGFRPSPNGGKCGAVALDSMVDGSAVYKAELWDGDKKVADFYVGNLPHPGSRMWGDIPNNIEKTTMFLRNLALGIPTQTRVLKFQLRPGWSADSGSDSDSDSVTI